MVNFVVRSIEKKARIELEQGQELYRKYFIYTAIYAACGCEEVPGIAVESAVNDSSGVLAGCVYTEEVAPGIAVRSAEARSLSDGAGEDRGVVDGNGYEFVAIAGNSVVDGYVGVGAVDATDTGVFLNDGTLAVVADAIAVEPFACGAREDDVVVLFYLVAGGER